MVEGHTNPAAEIPILLIPLSTLLVSPCNLTLLSKSRWRPRTDWEMTRPKIPIKRHPYWRLFLYNCVICYDGFPFKVLPGKTANFIFIFFKFLGIVKAFCSWTRNQARQQGPQLFRPVLLFCKEVTRPCHLIKCSSINLFWKNGHWRRRNLGL